MIEVNKFGDYVWEIKILEDMIFKNSSNLCLYLKNNLDEVKLPKQLIFNLKKVKYIDSSGVGVLLHMIYSYDIDFIIIELSDQVRRVMNFLGLDKILKDSYAIDRLKNPDANILLSKVSN